jgi:hypothetical protein
MSFSAYSKLKYCKLIALQCYIITMTTVTSPTQLNSGIGGAKNFYNWNWQGKIYQVVYETIGQGSPLLLLPAFSTVFSRTEMKGIAQILATRYEVTVLDWLGFGESECPL